MRSKSTFTFFRITGTSSRAQNQTERKIVEGSSASQEEQQIEKDIREDSEGDGLMMFDDPMFPPEFDHEEDDI